MMSFKEALKIWRGMSGHRWDQVVNFHKNIRMAIVQTKGPVIKSEKLI